MDGFSKREHWNQKLPWLGVAEMGRNYLMRILIFCIDKTTTCMIEMCLLAVLAFFGLFFALVIKLQAEVNWGEEWDARKAMA